MMKLDPNVAQSGSPKNFRTPHYINTIAKKKMPGRFIHSMGSVRSGRGANMMIDG